MKTNRTVDMTEGNILRHILIFAIPLFIGNIFQQFYNIMDMIIAGYLLNDDALAAIGATSALSSLIIGFSNGMNGGFGIIWSNKFGAKKEDELRHAIGLALLLNVVLITIITTISLLFLRSLLHKMNVPNTIFERSYTYMFVILLGLGVTLFYNMEAGILRAVGNSRVPLYFVIVSSVCNIGFNLLLVMGFGMDVEGLALGTIIAQACCVIGLFIYIYKNYPWLHLKGEDFKLNSVLIGQLFTSGLSMGLMLSIFSIGSVMLQGAINKLGKTIVTAHTAARRTLEMFMQPLATLAAAIATFVSQNYGAGNRRRIEKGIKLTCWVSLGWALFSFLFLRLFAKYIVIALTNTAKDEVIHNAVMNIGININFFFFLGILLVLRSAMQGFGQKIAPLIASAIELAMKVVAVYYIVPRYGYIGASYTEPSTWLFCMAFLVIVILFEKKKILSGFDAMK